VPTIILLSVISICAALVFYTIGVWWNFKTKRLTKGQAACFVLGLITDVAATSGMAASVKGEMRYDLHTISGYTALFLMMLVTTAAVVGIARQHEGVLSRFHKVSVPVWFIWMISWITGVVVGLQKY
jgi:uncharacterized repeat protein (TIGR03987 family)